MTRTDSEYIGTMMRINCSTQSSCAVTGEVIENMEPHLSLFRRIRISEKGVEKVIEGLESLERNENPISIHDGKECDICDSSNKKATSILFEDSPMLRICDSCEDNFSNVCEEYLDKIRKEYLYYDNSGFVLVNPDSPCEFPDVCGKGMSQSDFYIRIGFDDAGIAKVGTDVSNIGYLMDVLSEVPSTTEYASDCDICGKNVETGFCVGGQSSAYIYLCLDCKEGIKESLEKLLENNLDKIVAQTI